LNLNDVDIAVFTDGCETPTVDLELGVFLQQRLNRPVDVVIVQKVSPILQHEVLQKKVRIFEKAVAGRAFFENQSLRAYLMPAIISTKIIVKSIYLLEPDLTQSESVNLIHYSSFDPRFPHFQFARDSLLRHSLSDGGGAMSFSYQI
jgi:hypothetical protein